MSELRTDFKDDVLDVTQNEKRKYRVIHNDDGTISLEDATVYVQKGDNFGANELNEMNEVTNQMLGVNEKLEEINRHPKATLVSEEGTHDLRYSEKQLQIKEDDNWKPATVDMFYGDGKKINRILYAQTVDKTQVDKKIVNPECIQKHKYTVFNEEYHMFSQQNQYIFDKGQLTLLRALPAEIHASSAVITYKGDLHIFSAAKHYKYDGQYWATLEDLPFSIACVAVLYKDKLHFINAYEHYVYDGEVWTTLNDLPRDNTNYSHGVKFVYNDKLYSICYNAVYEYNDTSDSWTKIKTYNVLELSVKNGGNTYTIIENKLYVGGNSAYANSSSYPAHASGITIINLDNWTLEKACSLSIDNTVSRSASNGSLVNFKGDLYYLDAATGFTSLEYKADSWWYAGGLLPISNYDKFLVEYKGEKHLLGLNHITPSSSDSSSIFRVTKHLKCVDGVWETDLPCPVHVINAYSHVVAADDGIHVLGNSSSTNNSYSHGTGHYVYDGETWTAKTNMPATVEYCRNALAHKGELYIYRYNSSTYKNELYVFRDDEWVLLFNDTGLGNNGATGVNSMLMCSFKGNIWLFCNTAVYIYNDETQQMSGYDTLGFKIWKTPYFNSIDEELFIFGGAVSNADKTNQMGYVVRYIGTNKVDTQIATCASPPDKGSILIMDGDVAHLVQRDGITEETYNFKVDITQIIRAE